MKKFIIIFASVIAFLLLAAVLIPVLFKDDIQAQINKSLDENLNAKVYFDPDNFGLTLFKNFPNPTVTMADFGIIGTEEFEGDTLVHIGDFNISIDLFSLFGDNYKINSINLIDPKIYVKVLEDGTANYMIAKETEEVEEDTTETSNFNLSIESWKIENGYIKYDDKSMGFYGEFQGLEHKGSGDISLDIYDLKTYTRIAKTFVVYDGVSYLNGQETMADVTININMPEFKFTFKENLLKVNDFGLSFGGYIAMPQEDIDMDIYFASQYSDIKSLYSLIPGVYTEGYENIKAEGEMNFDGYVKGIYSETSMPAYKVALVAKNGNIQYPDLPTPISNINIDMLVECKDGVIDNTLIDIKQMHFDMGSNPFDGSLLIRNLKNYSMKANLRTSLNLAELSTMFPMEGLTMRGLFKLNLKADGVYDSIRNIIPAIEADMSMKEGYVKSDTFPKALENMSFVAKAACKTGKMQDGMLTVNDFIVTMGEDKLAGSLVLNNFENYNWDLKVKGGLDLEVISEIYPVEGMNYSGHVAADITTKGTYSDVEAERYDRLPTSGSVELTNFKYTSEELPGGVNIPASSVIFTPKNMEINSMSGTIGRSDFAVKGSINNYIDYVFQENALLKGKMYLTSKVIDVNEWMTGEPTEEVEDTMALEVIQIPKNVDFEFVSSIQTIYYDNLKLQNAKGLLVVRDGILNMKDLSFDMLGGNIVINGTYNTQDIDKPAFDYKMKVKSVSIPQAFNAFNTVKMFAPMAQLMSGDVSTDFNISGLLNQDLTPKFTSMNGKGLLEITEAFMTDTKLVAGLSSFLKTDAKSSSANKMSFKDVIMSAKIEDGRGHVNPFEVKIGDNPAKISGSIGIDGSLDYVVNTEVDAGQLGQQVNSLIAGFTGGDKAAAGSKMKLNIGVGGTYDKPKFNLLGATSADGKPMTVQETAKQEIKSQVEETKKEVETQVKQEAEKVVEEKKEEVQQQVDTLKKQAEKEVKDNLQKEIDKSSDNLKKSFKDLFKKK